MRRMKIKLHLAEQDISQSATYAPLERSQTTEVGLIRLVRTQRLDARRVKGTHAATRNALETKRDIMYKRAVGARCGPRRTVELQAVTAYRYRHRPW